MYWQEETNNAQVTIPDDVVDLVYQIRCTSLPVDHAWALATAIKGALPWFPEEPLAGLHLIHVADSGNGWERPQGENELLYPSRRTRLVLRMPKERLDEATVLVGKTLDISGHPLEVEKAKSRKLGVTDILYSRYVISDPAWSEVEFIDWAVSQLKSMRIQFKKILCGKISQLATPQGILMTRSLMVANLSFEDAIHLQEQGIGEGRAMGCGLFIPQKSF
ncbi:MAG: type I-MYXAN CRISPR-associated protein Cas6/Cmx6 [Candidatus Sedimenticola sp. (ex Thyasira tokunagai)]